MSEDQPSDFLPLKPETFHVLLSLTEGPMHGYGIIKAVERETEGRVRLEPSPLYRRLKRLMDASLLCQVEPSPPHPDERRMYYSLTDFGRRVLAAEAARITQLAAHRAVKDLAATATPEDVGA